MNILYIGAFPPNFLIKRTKGKIDSLYRDSWAMRKGFSSLPDVSLKVITSPDIPSWPRGPLFIHHEKNEDEGVVLVSELNIPIIKQIWTVFSMFAEAARQIRKFDAPVAVMIPYIVFRHVLTLRLLKVFFPHKVIQVAVVPDIFFPSKWLNKTINRFTERMASHFDAFILYTKKMAEHLHIPKGHYEVIEGFREVPERRAKSSDCFRLVYAGSLNLEYGVGRLVEAISLVTFPDIQLHLYGAGTAEPLILEKSKEDRRIVYHGMVSNAEAEDAIYTASALINPRNSSDGEYTEYSFPSKDIQYMSTGIITLLCKLPGMPSEYYGNFIDMGDATSSEIAVAITKVYNMSVQDRENLGQKARSFIIERMDCKKQAVRIVNLIQSVIKE